MPSKITWLASYPKSGNTWMRMFLASYSSDSPVDINHTGAFSYDDMAKYTYQVVSPKPIDELEAHEMAAIRGAYLVHMTNFAQDGRLFMKTHSCIGDVADYPMIPQEFTDSAIYMVRDPRDVVCSYAHHCNDSIDETIDFMLKPAATISHNTRFNALGTWEEHFKSWLADDLDFPRIFVKYEDMVEKPEALFRKVVEFLGWELDEDKLKRAIANTEFETLKKQEKTKGFKEQSTAGVNFFRQGKVGKWKDQLSDKQEKRISDAFTETMEKLGYGSYSNRE